MFSERASEKIGRCLKLSGRELQIVREVFDDRTEFAIADNLETSPHTVTLVQWLRFFNQFANE